MQNDSPLNNENKYNFNHLLKLYFMKFWQLMGLNILFSFVCLPIITIGPALTGANYVMKKYMDGHFVNIAKDFFKGFKEDFWKSVLLGLLAIIVTGALIIACWFYFSQSGTFKVTLYIGILSAIVLFFMVSIFQLAFLILVSVQLSFKHILINATILSLSNILRILVISITLIGLAIITIILFPLSTVFLLIFFPVLQIYIVHCLFSYIINETLIKYYV